MKERHVSPVLVENRFGELARVVGLFAGRGLTSTPRGQRDDHPAFSKIVRHAGQRGHRRANRQQLRKLVRVKKWSR